MKVAIISDYISSEKLGGLGEVTLNNYRYLKEKCKNFIKPYLITTGANSDNQQDSIRISRDINASYLVKSFFKIPRLINDFDIIHIHQSANAFFIMSGFFRKKYPKIMATFHSSKIKEASHIRQVKIGQYTFKPSGNEYLNRYVYKRMHILSDFILARRADFITAVSEKTKEEISRDYHIKKKIIEVIHNGIDTDCFNPSVKADSIRKKFNLDKKLVILTVNSFKISKRFFNLLYCLRGIVSLVPNAKLLMVGSVKKDKRYNELINKLIRENGLEDYVVFAGEILPDQMPKVYAASDIVVIPSSYENLPLVLLESMSMAKALICTDTGGINEVVESGKNGIIIKVDDIESLKEKIINLLEDENLRLKLGKAARDTVVKRFSSQNMMQGYIDAYERLYNNRN